MVEPQQEGVTGAGPQWETTKEVAILPSREVTEGRAKEHDVQRRLWRVRGRRCGHYVRAVLRGASASGLRARVPIRDRGHVPETVERGRLDRDLRSCVSAVEPAFLDELESAVVGAPHPFGRHLGLEVEPDVRGGQFREGAFKLRFFEVEGIVGDWRGGALLADQVRQGEEDVGGFPEIPGQSRRVRTSQDAGFPPNGTYDNCRIGHASPI